MVCMMPLHKQLLQAQPTLSRMVLPMRWPQPRKNMSVRAPAAALRGAAASPPSPSDSPDASDGSEELDVTLLIAACVRHDSHASPNGLRLALLPSAASLARLFEGTSSAAG